jgi:hypothetical protein
MNGELTIGMTSMNLQVIVPIMTKATLLDWVSRLRGHGAFDDDTIRAELQLEGSSSVLRRICVSWRVLRVCWW